MSMITHRVVVATIPIVLRQPQARRDKWPGHDIPALVEKFASELPARYRPLLVGPIAHDVNGGQCWFFSSAGSKGATSPGNEVYCLQEKFIMIFERPECQESDGSCVCSVVVTTWPDSLGGVGGGRARVTRRV